MTDIALTDLASITGGFTAPQIKTIENHAVTFAEHSLHTSPVFLGDVTNSVKGPTFSAKKGVLVSTGDEASVQFYVGRVGINKAGTPTSLKAL